LAENRATVSVPVRQTERMTSSHGPSEGRIGLPSASALYIAAVLGTGILVLPGLAADAAGPASILAVGIVSIFSIPLAGTFAALAARYPDGGGVATFVRLALGATAARATAYIFFLGAGIGAPVVAVLGGEYLAAFTGMPREWAGFVGMGFFVVALGLAWIGLRVSSAVQLGLTALLVAIVVLVVASGVPAAEPARLEPFLPNGWAGVGVAISLFVWAFSGWEAITHWAGEFRNPRRTLPLATAIAIVVVGASYLALQVVTVLVGVGGGGAVPLFDLVSLTIPGFGPAIVTAVAMIVILGVLNVYIPAFGNLVASLGRDGDLPRWFAKGGEPGGVPRRALLLVAVQCFVYLGIYLLLQADLTSFVLVQTASMATVYLLGVIAAVRLLERYSVGWWMAVVSVLLVAGLVTLAGAHLVVPAILALAAVAVTVVKRARARTPKEPVDV
jgi:amino acid efflux transporter